MCYLNFALKFQAFAEKTATKIFGVYFLLHSVYHLRFRFFNYNLVTKT